MTEFITHKFRGQDYRFAATPQLPSLIEEIFDDNYKVFSNNIAIRPGEVILDLGANEGVFAIMMSMAFPEARIIAYEPVPRTFDTLVANITANEARNVDAYQFGVGDGKIVSMDMVVSKDFSGGSTGMCTFNLEDHRLEHVHLVTLDTIFERHGIDRCRLLKMDIEGMEYEALYATSMLPRVDYMVAEFHMNRKLEFQGRRPDGLTTWVKSQTNLIHVDYCKMAE